MILKGLSRLGLGMAVAACGTGMRTPQLVTRYPVKQVERQDMVFVRSFDSVQGRHPPPIPKTRYYLYARDGYVCEVDYMQYEAVKAGDWVSCHWLPPNAATTTPS